MRLWTVVAGAAAIVASPAIAQDEPLPDPNDSSNRFTVAIGAAVVPDYEGSDDYRIIPGGAIRGSVGNMSFATRGTYLYVDLIGRPKSGIDLDVGPIVGVRLNRTGKIKDDFVDRLPDRKTAIEVGGFAGVSLHGLTNPYDTLAYRFDLLNDIGNAHQATIVSHNLDFSTPLSRTLFVSASASADFVEDGYADYYFSITPEEALASGLPSFNADGGLKNWKLGLLVNQSLSGDLLRGWSLFASGSYGKLQNDFKRSPIVDARGSATQKMGVVGLGFSW